MIHPIPYIHYSSTSQVFPAIVINSIQTVSDLKCFVSSQCPRGRTFDVLILKFKKKKVKVKLLRHVRLFLTPWTVAYHAPPSIGFSRQEYWVGCHFLLQRIFPIQGSNPNLLPCKQILYRLSHRRSPLK